MRAAARFVEPLAGTSSGVLAAHRARARRSVRLAGADRPRPRHRQGGADGPGRPAAEHDRSRHRFPPRSSASAATRRIRLLGTHEIAFDEKRDLIMNKRQKLPFHTNGMRFTAYDADGNELATRDYYSVGGGFVVNQDEAAEDRIVADTTAAALSVPQRRRTAGAVRSARADDRAADVRQRKRVAQRRRNPRRPAAIWAGDAGLRRARHPRRPARCPADCTCSAARRRCSRNCRAARSGACAIR